MFKYHYELYAATVSNAFYLTKKLGSKTDPMDKFVGTLLTFIVFFLLIAPFLLFSEYGGLTA